MLPRAIVSVASPSALLIAAGLLSGCIRTVGSGPDVGECAEYPDGAYTYGQIGIGRCLSGPAAMTFFEQDGTTWLAVTNANPYRNFDSGSVLLIDWSSLDLAAGRNPVSELTTHAAPTGSFVGGVAYEPDRQLLLVTERFSEGALTTSARDELLVFDVSTPSEIGPWEGGATLTLEDDPQPIAIDPDNDRAYVVNITDHTVSVIDTSTSPLEVVDVAPDAAISDGTLLDVVAPIGEPFAGALASVPNEGGSAAVLDSTTVVEADLVPTELWTLSWVDGEFRLWTSQEGGLVRYSTGGLEYVEGGFGLEVDPTEGTDVAEVAQPFIGLTDGALTLYFSDGGDLRVLYWDSSVGLWSWGGGTPVLIAGTEGGWDEWVGGATVIAIDGVPTAWYEGRESADAAPAIGMTSGDIGTWRTDEAPQITAPAGFEGVGQPWVRTDENTNTLRMWVSLWDGASWSIGLTESTDDGDTWAEVEQVLELPGEDIAAPAVTWANGRYLMWATRGDGAQWTYVSAWSWDGREWFDVDDVIESTVAYDPMHPPRAALEADATGGWRLEGRDVGLVSNPVFAGSEYLVEAAGFAVDVASGYEIGSALLGDTSANGIEPGSYVVVDDVPTMYATAIDDDMQPHLAILQWSAALETWLAVAEDAIPEGEGGNVTGARNPVVYGTDGDWSMYYAGADADGIYRIHWATSTDGLSWTPQEEAVLASQEGWDEIAQLPGSVELLDDGTVRLWYSGYNGSRYRIGSALGSDGDLTPEPSADLAWQLGTGRAGEFDDSGVRDPSVIRDGDLLHLWYAGFDGDTWRVGYASSTAGAAFERFTDPQTELALPVLEPVDRSFSASGVYAPLILEDGAGSYVGWYAGTDGSEPRIGLTLGSSPELFPAHRFPTAGDTIAFTTTRGSEDDTLIELEQSVEGASFSGRAASNAVLDEERGYLYVPSKLNNFVYVLDVRDDTDDTFVDLNYLDIEGVILLSTTTGPRGVRDVEPIPGTNLLYMTTWGPDALMVVDITDVVDDDRKQTYPNRMVAALPLPRAVEDEGLPTFTSQSQDQLGGGDMALDAADGILFVPHFQDNSVLVYDLNLGAWGEQRAYIPYVGEAPHLIRMSPDGRYAVVANYTGEAVDDDGFVSSTLAVIDADPSSPTYLQVITWITNQ